VVRRHTDTTARRDVLQRLCGPLLSLAAQATASTSRRCALWNPVNQQGTDLYTQIFKIVLSKAFDLKCTIPEIENVGEPLLLYQSC
jgi:hypothetical protein